MRISDWSSDVCSSDLSIAGRTAAASADAVADRIEALIRRNLEIHDRDCFNLNPATNVMNPAAEAALPRGLGSRPSLGWPGAKSERGLAAIGESEVIAAAQAAAACGAEHGRAACREGERQDG